MKRVLVTGGNRGIGLEICRQLDSLGYTVVMGSRDMEKGMRASASFSDHVLVKQLDVTDDESILRLAGWMDSGPGKLDVLINNAALGETEQEAGKTSGIRSFLDRNLPGAGKIARNLAPLFRKAGLVPDQKNVANIPLDGVKKLMDVNLYGAWKMIQVFLPLLLRSGKGRIINISSGSGAWESLAGDYPAYRLSKTSLNALTLMFAKQLKDTGISINAMCPGWVRTDMGGPNAHRSVAEGADTAVWLATAADIPTGKFFRDRKEIRW